MRVTSRFIVLGLVWLAGLLSTGAWPASPVGNIDGRVERVLIVGGGVSGLAAARHLHDAGYEVAVLEARDHLGGRVWTDRSTGVPLDMGANWIQGIRGNPITALADRLGLDRIATDWERWIDYEADGTRNPLSSAQYGEWEGVLRTYTREFVRRAPNATVQTMIDAARRTGDLDSLSDRQLDYVLNSYVELEYAADAAELSVRGLDEGAAFGGGDVVFPEGYDAIVESLASGLSVHLSTVVTAIEHGKFGIRIRTDRGYFEADRVVVTLPLGVLKSGTVEFTPRLPTPKRRAINRLAMGVLNKVWLVFGEVFWDPGPHWIGYLSEDKGRFAGWLNLAGHTGAPVLLAFNAGAYGAEVEALTDEQTVEAAMRVLRTLYGAAPDPVAARITRWKSDPFAYGSYSYLPPGARSAHRRRLARAVNGRLYFAGEATSWRYPATVHGAYLSGVRAADEIMARTDGRS